MGDGSPGLREAEGEGGEDFYIARSGKRADLLVTGGAGVPGGTWGRTKIASVMPLGKLVT